MSERAPPKRNDGPVSDHHFEIGRMARDFRRLADRVDRLEERVGHEARLLTAVPEMRARLPSHQEIVEFAEEITGSRHEVMNSDRVRKAIKAEANAVIAGSLLKSVGWFIAALVGVIAVYLFGRFTK